MMGMVEGVFDTIPIEDMPAEYPRIRNKIKLLGMSIRDHKDMIRQKMMVYSGIQNISVENINKNNNIRFDLYKEFIRAGFPYIQIEEEKQPQQGTIEDLVAEYKRIFPQNKAENDKK